jgi:hypothetical protein
MAELKQLKYTEATEDNISVEHHEGKLISLYSRYRISDLVAFQAGA